MESEFKNLILEIVVNATILKNKHTEEKDAPVSYVCIFCQSEEEQKTFLEFAEQMGSVIKETPTGSIYHIEPVETVAGTLKLLKIRKPDVTRPEKGDADFNVENYEEFKKKYLGKENFKLIVRPDIEMLELMDNKFDVRVYFSNPPVDKQLNV